MGVEGFLVVADVEHRVDGGDVDEFARGLIHLIHRKSEVLSRSDDDGHDFVLQKLCKYLIESKICIVDFLPDFYVA